MTQNGHKVLSELYARSAVKIQLFCAPIKTRRLLPASRLLRIASRLCRFQSEIGIMHSAASF